MVKYYSSYWFNFHGFKSNNLIPQDEYNNLIMSDNVVEQHRICT